MTSRAIQIRRVPVTLPPYALPAPVFRFRNLATLAGRAPIGGAREVALACFVAARLVNDCCDPLLALDAPTGSSSNSFGALSAEHAKCTVAPMNAKERTRASFMEGSTPTLRDAATRLESTPPYRSLLTLQNERNGPYTGPSEAFPQ